MKETYERTIFTVTRFDPDDVITTSEPFRSAPEEYETKFLKYIEER